VEKRVSLVGYGTRCFFRQACSLVAIPTEPFRLHFWKYGAVCLYTRTDDSVNPHASTVSMHWYPAARLHHVTSKIPPWEPQSCLKAIWMKFTMHAKCTYGYVCDVSVVGKLILKGSDGGVWQLGLMGVWTLPIVQYFKEHQRTVECFGLALSNGPNSVGLSHSVTWGRERLQVP
jgi:hypothetical protein